MVTGAKAVSVKGVDELRAALADAKSADGPVLVAVEVDPLVRTPSSESWWDVAVAEVAGIEPTASARKEYEAAKARQLATRGNYLKTSEGAGK